MNKNTYDELQNLLQALQDLYANARPGTPEHAVSCAAQQLSLAISFDETITYVP